MFLTVIRRRCACGSGDRERRWRAEPEHGAVAVACALNGLTEDEVTVKLLGGDLQIKWDREKNTVYMTGPAEVVFDGEWK